MAIFAVTKQFKKDKHARAHVSHNVVLNCCDTSSLIRTRSKLTNYNIRLHLPLEGSNTLTELIISCMHSDKIDAIQQLF